MGKTWKDSKFSSKSNNADFKKTKKNKDKKVEKNRSRYIFEE